MEARVMKIGLRLIAALFLFAQATASWAQWELDNSHSTVNFLSIKNASIAETHHFNTLVGFISSEGTVQLAIDLNSIDTAIPIRDDRLRDQLFETKKFSTATVRSKVDIAILAAVANGGSVSTELPLILSLHGFEENLTVPVNVFGESGKLRVITSRPVIVSAADFGLGESIEALREVAGLNSISTAVPVTVNLLFSHAP